MANLYRVMWFVLGVVLVSVPMIASAQTTHVHEIPAIFKAYNRSTFYAETPQSVCLLAHPSDPTYYPRPDWTDPATCTPYTYDKKDSRTSTCSVGHCSNPGYYASTRRVAYETYCPVGYTAHPGQKCRKSVTCAAGDTYNAETGQCVAPPTCEVGEVVSSGYYPIDGEDGQPNTPACLNQCELVFEGGSLHTTTSGETGETLFFMQGEYQKTGQNCTEGSGPSQPEQPPAPQCPPGYYPGEVNGQKTCKPEDKPPEDKPPPPFDCPDGTTRRYMFGSGNWICAPNTSIPECPEGTWWNGASCQPHPGCSSGFVKNDIGQCIQVSTSSTNTNTSNTNTTTTDTPDGPSGPGEPGTTTESGPGESTSSTTVTKVNEDGTKTVTTTTTTVITESKPDPADPTKTITEEKTQTTTETKVEQPTYRASACGSTPVCTGDAVQCAIAREAHSARCRDEKLETDGKTYLDGVGEGQVNQALVDQALNTSGAFDFDISERFAQAQGNYVTFTAECLPSVGFTFKGQTYTFNTQFLCEIAVFVRILMHIVAYTAVLAMVSRAFGGI